MSSGSPYIPGDLLGLAQAALTDEPHGGLGQVVTHDEDHQRRHGAESERYAPHQFVIHVENEEDRDDRERQNFAHGEHELPAVAHHLAFAFGHRVHDVGVASRDVAAERNAEEETDDGEHCDARDERLAHRQDDEENHGCEEHETPTDPVGQPAADEGADHRPTLRPGAHEAEQQRVRMILVADEDEDEGDAVEVPGLDQD
jgi:hypothetical protein